MRDFSRLFRKRQPTVSEQDRTPECLVRVGRPAHNCGGRCLLGIGPNSLQETVGKTRRWLSLGAVVLLGVELLVILLGISGIPAARGAASHAAIKITQGHGRLFRARLALTVAAILVSGAVLAPWGKGASTSAMIVLAFGLVLTAEVLGRLLFYEARVRHGV